MAKDDTQKELSDLFVIWGMAAVKTIIATAVAAGLGALFLAGASSALVVVGGLVVSAFMTFVLDSLDNYLGVSESMMQHLRKIGEHDTRAGLAGMGLNPEEYGP